MGFLFLNMIAPSPKGLGWQVFLKRLPGFFQVVFNQCNQRRDFCAVLFIGLVLVGCGTTSPVIRSSIPKLSEIRSFVCYFGGKGYLGQLSRFDLVMIDPDEYTAEDVLALKARGKIVIGYLSVGEAEDYRWFFSRVKPDWLGKENPNWPGHFYMNANRPGWHRLLLGTVIPAIMEKGFDGLYLDTVDTASPYNFPETRPGMITLIKEIRKAFPGVILIASNADFMIEDIFSSVDALAVEDLFSYYDHEDKSYKKTPPDVREPLLRKLLSIRESYKLPIFTIDYAEPTDGSLIRYAYRSSSGYGFIPYVGTVELDRIFFYRGKNLRP